MMTALSFTQSLRDCPSGRLICIREDFFQKSPNCFATIPYANIQSRKNKFEILPPSREKLTR